jgi:hypothetical protein
MDRAINFHLLDRCRCIVREAAPTRRITIFFHPDSTTRACGNLDVIFFSQCMEEIGFSPIKESTVFPIVGVCEGTVVSQAVELQTPTGSSDDQKLEALRRLDQFRQWRALDERRYCLVCGKVITGRQIQVVGGTLGPMKLSCPTEGCNSIPMDWVLPTNEILAKVNEPATGERKAWGLRPEAVTNGTRKLTREQTGHNYLVSRFLKFAFKRHP